MKEFTYMPEGVCSRCIHLALEGKRIASVSFEGGCHGNLQGIAALVEGMPAAEVANRLRGIRCREKPTSCPDQLARALEKCLEQEVTEP